MVMKNGLVLSVFLSLISLQLCAHEATPFKYIHGSETLQEYEHSDCECSHLDYDDEEEVVSDEIGYSRWTCWSCFWIHNPDYSTICSQCGKPRPNN